jgi:hypothetical protein
MVVVAPGMQKKPASTRIDYPAKFNPIRGFIADVLIERNGIRTLACIIPNVIRMYDVYCHCNPSTPDIFVHIPMALISDILERSELQSPVLIVSSPSAKPQHGNKYRRNKDPFPENSGGTKQRAKNQ